MIVARLALLPLLVALVAGCATPPYRPSEVQSPGLVVEVYQSITSWGVGAVVGPRHVITTEHVMDGASRAEVNGRPAKVVSRFRSNIEDIILLEVAKGYPSFEPDEIFVVTPGAQLYEVWTLRGRQLVSPSLVYSGDSGSPVLTVSGTIVGLVWGRRHSDHVDWDDHKSEVVPGQFTLINRIPSDFKLP